MKQNKIKKNAAIIQSAYGIGWNEVVSVASALDKLAKADEWMDSILSNARSLNRDYTDALKVPSWLMKARAISPRTSRKALKIRIKQRNRHEQSGL